MHANELQEMEWLAGQLATTAARLTRAVSLLRNNADLERAEARIAALAVVKPAQATAASAARHQPAASGPAVQRSLVASPAPLAARPAKARTGSSAEGSSRAFAVFDAGTLERTEFATMSAGKAAGVAGRVVNDRQTLDDIPF